MKASFINLRSVPLKTARMVLGSSLILFSLTAWASSDVTGEDLYEKRCALCHKLPEPTHVPPEGWEKQMEAMAPLARLKKNQKLEILHYLQDHAKKETIEAIAMSERALVEDKCTSCHNLGRVSLESFDGEAGQHVLERMQSYTGTETISNDELQRILSYLRQRKDLTPIEPPVAEAPPAELFQVRCSACHALERVIALVANKEKPGTSWIHVITRMQEKAPDWITPDESQRILSYILSLENKDSNSP